MSCSWLLQDAAAKSGCGQTSAWGRGQGRGAGPGQGHLPHGMLTNLGSLAPTYTHGNGKPMRSGIHMRRPQPEQARPGGSWQGPGLGGGRAAAGQLPGRQDHLRELVFWLGLVSAVGQVMHAMLQVTKSGSA